MMEYKGYIGKVEFDPDAGILHGEVVNTRDVITFQGESAAELTRAFHDSVDDYLAFCAERGEKPDKPFSGQFVTRVSPALHRHVSFAASLSGKSLNAWVTEQLQLAIDRAGIVKLKRKTREVRKSPARPAKRQQLPARKLA